MNTPSNRLSAIALALFALLGCGEKPPAFEGPKPLVWDDALVRTFSEMPVQDAGRIKPLSTYARFELLKVSSGTTLKLQDGDESRRLGAMEWLLDVMFFPDIARHYRCFVVDDDQVLKAVGLTVEGRKKRDRYSYDELSPVQSALTERARAYEKIDAKERTPVQEHTLRLAMGLAEVGHLLGYLDFARASYSMRGDSSLSALFDGAEEVSFADLIARMDDVIALASKAQQSGGDEIHSAFEGVFRDLEHGLFSSQILRLLAPVPHIHADGQEHDTEDWLTPYDACLQQAVHRYQAGLDAGLVPDPHRRAVQRLARLAQMARVEDGRATIADPDAFARVAGELADELRALAEDRGEYRKIPTEVTFYRGKFFWFNPWFFLLGFLLVALSFGTERGVKTLARAGGLVIAVSLALLVAGIAYRCVIRGRPPVSTLYETILFITAVGVLVLLVMEWIHPQRIALGVAGLMGTVGMFLANRYELHEATDTMPQLVAVLDTNFWLSTHVTSITVGYAAGLLAALLGHAYLLLRMIGGEGYAGALRVIARMTYGALCFGLLFSTVGTILGGVWANDSWGRFWGWDPKENGALMIVLSQLMILHGRLGGLIRDFGVAVCSVLSGLIVVFSWWGVNLLGIGLHSYGFASGVATALKWFYGGEASFLAAVAAWWVIRRLMVRPRPV